MSEQINLEYFPAAFDCVATEVHETAVSKGWWTDKIKLLEAAANESDHLGKFARSVTQSSEIALVHSELSEALEGLREGNIPDDKIPEFTMQEAEFADVIIRIMDITKGRRLRVAQALMAKIQMNKSREPMHGKKF